jgi:hypothetical protein
MYAPALECDAHEAGRSRLDALLRDGGTKLDHGHHAIERAFVGEK